MHRKVALHKLRVFDEYGQRGRVCESCLKSGDIDGRLKRHAEALESYAHFVRSQIGRLEVPRYREWEDAEKQAIRSVEEAFEAKAKADAEAEAIPF
jgi:hypothetical protein